MEDELKLYEIWRYTIIRGVRPKVQIGFSAGVNEDDAMINYIKNNEDYVKSNPSWRACYRRELRACEFKLPRFIIKVESLDQKVSF